MSEAASRPPYSAEASPGVPESASAGSRGAEESSATSRPAEALTAAESPPVEGAGGGPNPLPSYLNIVLVNFDDAGRSQFGWYSEFNRWPSASHPYAKTPWIDSKIAQGVRFTNARVAARCAPTRACNLTGRQPHISSVHPHGTGVGNIPQQDGLTAEYPVTEGVTADMNPWPKVVSELTNHYLLHVGKVHCSAHDFNGTAAIEREPFSQICTEMGFHRAFKTELGIQNIPSEPFRGYTGFDARRIDADGTETVLDPGSDYITTWELDQIEADLAAVWAEDAQRPFVLHWWTNSPHQVMPAVEVSTTPGWGLTARTATFTQQELIPGVRSADGKVSYDVINDEFAGDFVTYGPGYDEDGLPSSPFEPGDLDYPYGPNGAVSVVWRRHLAQLESWDAYLQSFDNWLETNYPDQHARTIYIIHCDNGEQDVAVVPYKDGAFTLLGPEYSVLPPTSDGTVTGDTYHDPDQAKDTVFDEGILTPLVVFGEPLPEAVRGTDSSILTDATDWHPTMLDLLRPGWESALSATERGKIDGESWAPGLWDADFLGREYSLHQIYKPSPAPEGSLNRIQRCVIDREGFKLMRAYEEALSQDEWFLFDTANDPGETTNLYSDIAYEDKLKELRGVYNQLIGNED